MAVTPGRSRMRVGTPRRFWVWMAAVWLGLRALAMLMGPSSPAPALAAKVMHVGYFSMNLKRDLGTTAAVRMSDPRPWGVRVMLTLPPDEAHVKLRWEFVHPPMRLPNGRVSARDGGEQGGEAGDFVAAWRFRKDRKFEWVPGRWVEHVYAGGRPVAAQAFTVR